VGVRNKQDESLGIGGSAASRLPVEGRKRLYDMYPMSDFPITKSRSTVSKHSPTLTLVERK
jgi:hypothetical protein